MEAYSTSEGVWSCRIRRMVRAIFVYFISCILSILILFDFAVDFPNYKWGIFFFGSLLLFVFFYQEIDSQQDRIRILYHLDPKSILPIIKKMHPANMLAFIILAGFITCAFKTPVNEAMSSVLPIKKVEVTGIGAGEIVIVDNGGRDSLFMPCTQGEVCGNWQGGEGVFYVISDGNDEPKIAFNAKASYPGCLTFVRSQNGGTICVSVDGYDQIMDLKCEGEAERINIFPFENMKGGILLNILIYIGVFAIILWVLLGLTNYFQTSSIVVGKILYREYRYRYTLILWIVLIFYSLFQKVIGVSGDSHFGDQGYYWLSLLHDGRFDAQWLSSCTYSFRGYFGNVFPTISLIIGDKFGIEPVYVFLVFSSGALAVLLGVFLPIIFQNMTSECTRVIHVFSSLLFFVTFWNGMLTAVLTDVFALTCFVGGCSFVIKFLKEQKLIFSIVAGCLFSAASNLRMTYITGICAVVGILIGFFVYSKITNKEVIDKKIIKRYVLGFCALIIGFVIIAAPQMQINYYKGDIGMLPFDHKGSWVLPDQIKETSLTVYGANYTLRQSYIWYPFQESDAQQLSMKTQIYPDAEEFLSVPQILNVLLHSPMDTVIYLLKKFSLAFDVKTSHVYPLTEGGITYWRESRGILFSLLNYSSIAVAIFVLFFCGKDYFKERMVFLFLLIGIALPQMFTHIEWRYFFSLYLWCYYILSYYLIDQIIVKNKREWLYSNSKLYVVLAVYLMIAFTINFSIAA